ncbi:Uncharacterised protein [Vibrio cholerae]|nr:Uncharacterised protein [Vibrio cholerae]
MSLILSKEQRPRVRGRCRQSFIVNRELRLFRQRHHFANIR